MSFLALWSQERKLSCCFGLWRTLVLPHVSSGVLLNQYPLCTRNSQWTCDPDLNGFSGIFAVHLAKVISDFATLVLCHFPDPLSLFPLVV